MISDVSDDLIREVRIAVFCVDGLGHDRHGKSMPLERENSSSSPGATVASLSRGRRFRHRGGFNFPLLVAPARTATIFYGAEFTFPLGVAHPVNGRSHQDQHQCAYHHGQQ